MPLRVERLESQRPQRVTRRRPQTRSELYTSQIKRSCLGSYVLRVDSAINGFMHTRLRFATYTAPKLVKLEDWRLLLLHYALAAIVLSAAFGQFFYHMLYLAEEGISTGAAISVNTNDVEAYRSETIKLVNEGYATCQGYDEYHDVTTAGCWLPVPDELYEIADNYAFVASKTDFIKTLYAPSSTGNSSSCDMDFENASIDSNYCRFVNETAQNATGELFFLDGEVTTGYVAGDTSGVYTTSISSGSCFCETKATMLAMGVDAIHITMDHYFTSKHTKDFLVKTDVYTGQAKGDAKATFDVLSSVSGSLSEWLSWAEVDLDLPWNEGINKQWTSDIEYFENYDLNRSPRLTGTAATFLPLFTLRVIGTVNSFLPLITLRATVTAATYLSHFTVRTIGTAATFLPLINLRATDTAATRLPLGWPSSPFVGQPRPLH
ncbi:hypothetical protein CYMTET_23186, partial [Cymbomonas tetramitiformis]